MWLLDFLRRTFLPIHTIIRRRRFYSETAVLVQYRGSQRNSERPIDLRTVDRFSECTNQPKYVPIDAAPAWTGLGYPAVRREKRRRHLHEAWRCGVDCQN